MLRWQQDQRVEWHYIAPGTPMQNRLVDRFTGDRRDQCLNEHLFTSYRHAQAIIKDRRIDYHARRPHTSLYGLTPMEFATRSGAAHKKPRAIYEPGQIGDQVN